jgi:hypothetical protein
VAKTLEWNPEEIGVCARKPLFLKVAQLVGVLLAFAAVLQHICETYCKGMNSARARKRRRILGHILHSRRMSAQHRE